MPRQARLDHPGLLHHVSARGINRGEIFRDARDREVFVERLGELVLAAGARVYAWGLLDNHFHLVLRSGERGLAWLMQRVMTGHAVRYNLRHNRSGHLFQNRYKNIVVEEEPHFLELVRYVVLNPVRAGLVASPEELDRYAWNGHAVVMGTHQAPWQDIAEVLARFAGKRNAAIARYREFVADGWNQGRRDELTGGGLIRSAGGHDVAAGRRSEEREAADERILGSGAFVEEVWQATETVRSPGLGRSWEAILKEVATGCGLAPAQIVGRSRERLICRARRQFLLRSLAEAGVSMSELGRICARNPASISRAIEQARVEAAEEVDADGG